VLFSAAITPRGRERRNENGSMTANDGSTTQPAAGSAPPRPRDPRRSTGKPPLWPYLAIILGLAAFIGLIAHFAAPPPAPDRSAEPAPTALPRPPIALAPPPAPPSMLEGVDLRTQDPATLARQARKLAASGEHALAIPLEHWAVVGGHKGKYDLACDYARDGQVDAAIYWLESAVDEGVDASWAEKDSDLLAVRGDPRWRTLRTFLGEAARYWAASGLKVTRVVVPKGYTPGRPIPVVVGLHGMGSVPDAFAGEGYQDFADALSVAFVSASGTIPNGPASFHWAESVASDEARLDDALKEASDRVTIDRGKIVLIGFSQGAQMAALIAANHPEKYAGAIIMSPGTQRDLTLEDLVAAPALAQRRFVIVVGAGEHPGTVGIAVSDARFLRGARADVFYRAYEGVKTHSFPPDFGSALPRWIQYILGTGPKPQDGEAQ
jgi:predicted esterase